MKPRALTNIPASVHQRLLNKAQESGRTFNELLRYYAMERFLYRLSISPYAGQFVLKGALMLEVWQAPLSRSTLDIDLLGRGSNNMDNIAAVIKQTCLQQAEPDGMAFDAETIRAQRIAENAEYQGVRVQFSGSLGNARIPMQIDIGFGGKVIPAPRMVKYPSLLDFPPPRLRGYSKESTIAEKFEALVRLDMLNSRMKDFYDILLLSRNFNFNGPTLCKAIAAVFSTRGTLLPESPPAGLSPQFAGDRSKQMQWSAFLRKGRLTAEPNLAKVAVALQEFLMPPTVALSSSRPFEMKWTPANGWRPK